ncbi:hypothetical protein JCGZ_27044 [Jatropha curcas]|uniref:Uncharacterized protein n=1 Tax=Jatropha curcas TaxID=180498 RepID=A0A067JJ68_JATCU|nr:hypothetical protein JCGZ_27044 [Jatropha curcas]
MSAPVLMLAVQQRSIGTIWELVGVIMRRSAPIGANYCRWLDIGVFRLSGVRSRAKRRPIELILAPLEL